jgi:hypothetical protein
MSNRNTHSNKRNTSTGLGGLTTNSLLHHLSPIERHNEQNEARISRGIEQNLELQRSIDEVRQLEKEQKTQDAKHNSDRVIAALQKKKTFIQWLTDDYLKAIFLSITTLFLGAVVGAIFG